MFPPAAELHQDKANPDEFPLKLVLTPQATDEGDAATLVGVVGEATVTTTDVLSGLEHDVAVHEIVTCPLPVLPDAPE